MKKHDNRENAAGGPMLRKRPMVEVLAYSGLILLSDRALEKLGCKLGDRVKYGSFKGSQMFIQKSEESGAYLLKPVMGDDTGAAQFTVQLLMKQGVGEQQRCALVDGPLQGWFEIVPEKEMEVRNGN